MKYKNLFNLQGKVAVVTGGAGLIGEEIVRALAENGAITIIADVEKTKGINIRNKLLDVNPGTIFRYVDITSSKSISGLIRFLDKEYGRIDILVNSAYPRTKDWGLEFENISFASWEKNINMHLGGYFLCSQKIGEYMRRKKGGSIINIASIYGIVGPDFSLYKDANMTMPAAYSAIKGAIVNFTRYLASYYGKDNVRVNCISPGGVYNRQPVTFVKRYINKTPLRRMAEREDIVGAVIYLASDASGYVTGHNLVVDGGWTII